MKIKKCREIVDEIFEELKGWVLLEEELSDLAVEDVRKLKEACAKIIKASMEGGE